MDGVGRGEPRLPLDLLPGDDPGDLRLARVGADIEDVQVAGTEAGHDQMLTLDIGMAGAAARLPAVVMQFVADAGHRRAMRDLAVGIGLRIEIDDGEEVRLIHAGAGVEGGDVGELLGR